MKYIFSEFEKQTFVVDACNGMAETLKENGYDPAKDIDWFSYAEIAYCYAGK